MLGSKVVLSALWLLLQARPAPPVIVAPASPVVVAYESLGGRPVVMVSINGSGPYKFIFDTGASGTVVDTGLAEELELPVIGKARIGSPIGGAVTESNIVKVVTADLGALRIEGLACATMALASGFTGPARPRGVLSPASIPGLLVSIDYPKGRLRFERGQLPAADNSEIFEYGEAARLPAVRATVAGLDVELHVDSGSPGFITLANRFVAKLPLNGVPREVGRARTAGGDVAISEAGLNGDVRVGGQTIHNPTLRFTDSQADGNLGAAFLRDYVVTLDREQRRIKLVRAPAPAGGAAPAKPPAPRYASYAGRYGTRTISLERDALYLQRDGGPRLRLLPAGDQEFTLEGLPATARVRFVASAAGVELHVLNPQGEWEISRRE